MPCPPPSLKERARRVAGRVHVRVAVALVAATVAGLALARSGVSVRALAQSARGLPAASLLMAFGLVLAQLGLQFAHLRLLVGRRTARGTLALAHAFFGGQVLSATLPARAGDAVRVVGVAEGQRARLHHAAGLVLADKLLEALGLALLALPAAGQLRPTMPRVSSLALALGAGLAVLLAIAAVWGRQWLRLLVVGRGFVSGLGALRRPARALPSFAVVLAGWACEIASIQVIAEPMGLHLPFAPVAVAIVATNLAILVPVSPANLGTFELGLSLGLTGFGFAAAPVAALALIHHSLELLGTATWYVTARLFRPGSSPRRPPSGVDLSPSAERLGLRFVPARPRLTGPGPWAAAATPQGTVARPVPGAD